MSVGVFPSYSTANHRTLIAAHLGAHKDGAAIPSSNSFSYMQTYYK
jgi:hypothetical protein